MRTRFQNLLAFKCNLFRYASVETDVGGDELGGEGGEGRNETKRESMAAGWGSCTSRIQLLTQSLKAPGFNP